MEAEGFQKEMYPHWQGPRQPPCNKVPEDIRRLRDGNVAQEYKRELAESSSEFTDSDDTEKL